MVSPRDKQLDQEFRNYLQRWQNATQNFDDSPHNIQQTIAELPDDRRRKLFDAVQTILGYEMEVEKTIPDNEMSSRYITLNGQNLSYSSSGVRILVTLLTALMNTDYSHFLIDESELGISPEGQRILSEFIFSQQMRGEYFSHVRSIFFSTHSPIFIDRRQISNNLIVSKLGDAVSLERVESVGQLSQINFMLLGNRLEDIHLPSAIVLVEGASEEKVFPSLIRRRYPDAAVSVINTSGDSRVKQYAHTIRGIFGDLELSPYRDRVLCVLDSRHSKNLVPDLEKMGIPPQSIVVWEKNGIEYYYPPSLMERIFRGPTELVIADDNVSANGITVRKLDLAERIADRVDEKTLFAPEFEQKFIARLEPLINVGMS